MAKLIDPVVATAFESAVKIAYQGGGVLRPYVLVKTRFVGRTVEFPRFGRGMARPHVPASPRVPMGAVYNKAVAQLAGWDASEYADSIEALQIAFDERNPLAETIALAQARRQDQIIIDVLAAEKATADIPAAATGMTADKIRTAVELFDRLGIPNQDRVLAVAPRQYREMRAITELSSRDFGETAVARTGQLPTVYGMTVVMIDTLGRPEGGLPVSGTTRQCFAFHRNAIGLAVSKEPAVAIEWIAERRAWLVTSQMLAGACVIDPEGLFRIDCVES